MSIVTSEDDSGAATSVVHWCWRNPHTHWERHYLRALQSNSHVPVAQRTVHRMHRPLLLLSGAFALGTKEGGRSREFASSAQHYLMIIRAVSLPLAYPASARALGLLQNGLVTEGGAVTPSR